MLRNIIFKNFIKLKKKKNSGNKKKFFIILINFVMQDYAQQLFWWFIKSLIQLYSLEYFGKIFALLHFLIKLLAIIEIFYV